MATGAPIRMNMVPLRMTMTTDILTLSQLLSPSFPVGAFAYSHGLETAISEGQIVSAPTLQSWLMDLLEHGGAQSDALLLNAVFGSAEDAVQNIDTHARAFAASAERLRETDLQGAAFCETVQTVWGIELGRLCYPVAVLHVAHRQHKDAAVTFRRTRHVLRIRLPDGLIRARRNRTTRRCPDLKVESGARRGRKRPEILD